VVSLAEVLLGELRKIVIALKRNGEYAQDI